jgi:uncharacterized protein
MANIQLERLAARRLPQASTRRLCLLTGARQVGKTSLARATYPGLRYQAFLLPPFREKLTSSVVKAPKLHWADLGIARHLAGFAGPLSGPLFETLVVGESVKLVRTLGLEVEAFFYRTRSGMEIDTLLCSARGILALEAKARPAWAAADLGPMKAVADALGPRFRGGIVVTLGGRLEPASSDGRFWCVPAHRLFS